MLDYLKNILTSIKTEKRKTFNLASLGYAAAVITYFNAYKGYYGFVITLGFIGFGFINYGLVLLGNRINTKLTEKTLNILRFYYDIVVCISVMALVNAGISGGVTVVLGQITGGNTMLEAVAIIILLMLLLFAIPQVENFFERVGSNYFVLIMLQPLLMFVGKLWNTGNYLSQGLNKIFILLSVCNIIGYYIRLKIQNNYLLQPLFEFDDNAKNIIFLVICSSAFSVTMIQNTYANGLVFNNNLYYSILNFSICFSFIVFSREYCCALNRRIINFLFLILIFVTIYYVLYGEIFIYVVYVLGVAAIGFDSNKIIKTGLLICAIEYIVVASMAMIGIYKDDFSFKDYIVSHNLGQGNENFTSMQLTIIMIMFLFLRKHRTIYDKCVNVIICGGIVVFESLFTAGRTAIFAALYVFGGLVLLYSVSSALKRGMHCKNQVVYYVMLIWTEGTLVISVLFSLIFTWLFDSDTLKPLREWMSRSSSLHSTYIRFDLCNLGMHKYIPRLFGQIIEDFQDGVYVGFDILYVRQLYKQAVIIFICYSLFMSVLLVRLCKKRMYIQAFAISVIPAMGIFEALVGDIMYNIFPIIAFSNIVDYGENLENQNQDEKNASTNILIRIGSFVLLAPILIYWGRTIYSSGKTDLNEAQYFVAAIIFLVVLYIGANYILQYIECLKEKRMNLRVLVPLTVCVVIIVGEFFVAESQLEKVREATLKQISEEDLFVNCVLNNSTGNVYAYALPEVYKSNYSGISFYPLNCEALGRDENVTIITKAEYNSSSLLGNGFLYLQMSDDGAIYTNDSSVIMALNDEGYNPKGYYSYINKVDMDYIAEINNLGRNEEGGILLDGSAASLYYGPYVNLSSGKYMVIYDVEIDPIEYTEDYEIMTVKVESRWGEDTLAQKSVRRSDFGINGKLSVGLMINVNKDSGQGIEYKAFAVDGQKITINCIEYSLAPDYDRHFEIDENGRTVKEMYFTLEGKPYTMSNGSSGMSYVYDESGNKIEYVYLDEKGFPTTNTSGYTIMRRAYDDNKRVIMESYHDSEGNLVNLTTGQSIVKYEYDENGNKRAIKYYDKYEKPVLYNDQYWRVEYVYNEDKKNIHEVYYGIDDELILLKDGSCGYDREYDEAGNVITITYLGTNLKPIINTSGYAILRRTYNDKKQVIHEEYYGTDGNLIQLSDGSYGYDRKYDDAGNCNECTYLGADLQPTINTSGYAMWRRLYNDKKQVVREEYFNVDGNPLALSTGQAAVEYEYDENGNRTVVRYYDADNNPVLYQGSYWYYRVTYNEKNQNILEEYYGTDGEKISRSDGACAYAREYDDAGNVIKLSYLGIDGNPAINTSGYSFWKRQYSESKQVLREEYYGTNGTPIALPTGEAAVEYQYDENGNKTEIRYLDIENKLVMRNGEYAYMKLTYNDSNVKVIEALYDAEGNLISKNYTEGYEDYEEVMAQQEEEPESTEQGDENAEDASEEELVEENVGEVEENLSEEEAESENASEQNDNSSSQNDVTDDADIPAGISKGDYRIYDPNATYRSVNEKVTAISGTVNLRNIPSLDESSVIMYKLKAGETIVRTGIGKNGWSQLSFKGRTIYGVTEFLKVYDESEQEQQDQAGEGQQSGEGQQNQNQSDTTHQNNSQNTQDSASSTQSKSKDPTAYSISWGKDNKNCTIWSSGKLQGTMTVTDAEGEVKTMTNYGLYYSGSGKNQKKYLNISVPKGESELTVNTDGGFVECMKIMGYSGLYFNKQVINW